MKDRLLIFSLVSWILIWMKTSSTETLKSRQMAKLYKQEEAASYDEKHQGMHL